LVQALRRVDRAALEAALAREKSLQLARFRSPEVRAKVADFVQKRSARGSG
jgi:enoyl-CoA hydratase/carnithine racemase